MQCDQCSINLSEENTYERVLCGLCHKSEDIPPKTHCVKCACKIHWKSAVEKLVSRLRKATVFITWGIAAAILILDILLAVRHHTMIGFRITIGIVALPIVAAVSLLALVILFPLSYFTGEWVLDTTGALDKSETDFVPDVLRWLLGLVIFCSPLEVWWLGGVVCRAFHLM